MPLVWIPNRGKTVYGNVSRNSAIAFFIFYNIATAVIHKETKYVTKL